MAAVSRTSYDQARDVHAVLDLLLDARLASGMDRYPTLPRLELLLSSRLWDPAQDTRLWHNAAGQLVAFAGLFRRRPNDASMGLTYVVHPAARNGKVDAAALKWALSRAGAFAHERDSPITLSADPDDDHPEWVELLNRQGFAPADQGDVYMECPLVVASTNVAPPTGYIVRPLDGEGELDAYTALYGFAPMSTEHRLSLLRRPDYTHIVAVAPDGSFAAYCECSYCPREWAKGAPHIAWVDYIGTAVEHQRRGLGRAVLAAGLGQMRGWGAQSARLVTMASNTTSQSVYTAAGFRAATAVRGYLKTVSLA